MGSLTAVAWTDPPAAWDTLVRDDPNATPAHRPALWRALAAVLPGMHAGFAGVEDDGELVGGTGFLIERRAGFHWIHAMPYLLPGAPLARAGRHAEVDAACAAHLAGRQRALHAVGGEWVLYRPAGPPVETATAATVGGETRVHETWSVDLTPGADALWDALDRNTRHVLRRAGAGELHAAEEPGALAEAHALHLAQARDWPGFRPLPLEVSRRILDARDGDAPLARLYTVRDARRLVAALFLLDHPRERFAWWSGMHESGRAAGAMPHLFWTLVTDAARAGCTRLNLGGGTGRDALAQFKRAFGAAGRRDPVRWLDARHASWAGRALGAAQARLRRGRVTGEPA